MSEFFILVLQDSNKYTALDKERMNGTKHTAIN